jgi:formate dehydrogenase iron-sulfur subunit
VESQARSSGALSVKRISASPDPAPGIREGPEFAKLVDISRCIGCKGCEVACKEWNELKAEPTYNFGSYQSHLDLTPDTWLLMRFHETDVDGTLQWLITKDACLHCEEPGCLYACPAPGAIVQYDNGIVDFNQEHCIGCQYCVSGCPFDIPRFNSATRKVYKCNMCIDRVEAGLEPACVKTCPTNAIAWGSKEDMKTLAENKVAALRERGYAQATVYDPPGVGGTHMFYVVPHGDRLEEYGLPSDPTASPGALSALAGLKKLGAAVMGVGLVAAALHYLRYGPEVPEEGGEAEAVEAGAAARGEPGP